MKDKLRISRNFLATLLLASLPCQTATIQAAPGGGHGGSIGHGAGGVHAVPGGGGWRGGGGPYYRGGYYGYPYGYGGFGFGLGFGYGLGYGLGGYGYPYYGYGYPGYAYPYYVDYPAAYDGYPQQVPQQGNPGPLGGSSAAPSEPSSVLTAKFADTDMVLTVRCPKDATVWINGEKTTQTGMTRQFVSSGLESGKAYSYEVRTRWQEGDGTGVELTRHVTVHAGEKHTVDFTMRAPPK